MQKKKLDPKPRTQPKSIVAPRLDLDRTGMCDGAQPAHAEAASDCVRHFVGVLAVGRLADVLSGPLGSLVIKNLRVRPQQIRSIESVERLLSAAAEITSRQRSEKPISIERISTVAGVTPQAAYRYFKDSDELIKTGLRCIAIGEYEKIAACLSNRILLDEAEMAKIVVAVVLDTCETIRCFPAHMREHLLGEYRQVGYDASSLLSDLMCMNVHPTDIRHSLDAIKTSVALTAIIAVATSFLPKKITSLRGGRLEDMLANLFVSILKSGENSFDAFREMGTELDAFWKGQAG